MREIIFRTYSEKLEKYIGEWGVFHNPIDESFQAGPPSGIQGKIYHEQFTGLLDKNGKQIYENDICRIYYDDGATEDMRVDWDIEKAQFRFLDAHGDGWIITQTPIEVISTIHDAEYKELAK